MTTTTTTTEAGRVVATAAIANRQQLANEAKEHARASLRDARADTTTPLFPETVGKAALATLPEPPAVAPVADAKGKFSLSTTIEHRGRAITIHAEGVTIDQFCDLLDKRKYQSPQLLSAPLATADDLPDGYKLCRKHGAGMKMRFKQGDSWNSHNVGTADNPVWCKGYRGPDSPGYEVD